MSKYNKPTTRNIASNLSQKIGAIVEQQKEDIERVAELERRSVRAFNFIEALMEHAGVEEVQKIFAAQAAARDAEFQAKQAEALAQGLEAGFISKAEKMTALSLVVLRYLNADGSVRPPGRVQLGFSEFAPNYHPMILDQEVGFTLDLVGRDGKKDGSKAEIMEIYQLDAEKYAAWQRQQLEESVAQNAAEGASEEKTEKTPVAEGEPVDEEKTPEGTVEPQVEA